MANINLKQLIGKLNDTTRRSLEAASGLCLSRTHYNIEIEHWLLKLLENAGSDIHLILRQFNIDPLRLQADLSQSLGRFQNWQRASAGDQPRLNQTCQRSVGHWIGRTRWNRGAFGIPIVRFDGR